MCSKVFYLPKTNESKFVMNRIIENVACGLDDIKTVKNGETPMLKFSITCTEASLKKVLQILRTYGYIE